MEGLEHSGSDWDSPNTIDVAWTFSGCLALIPGAETGPLQLTRCGFRRGTTGRFGRPSNTGRTRAALAMLQTRPRRLDLLRFLPSSCYCFAALRLPVASGFAGTLPERPCKSRGARTTPSLSVSFRSVRIFWAAATGAPAGAVAYPVAFGQSHELGTFRTTGDTFPSPAVIPAGHLRSKA
jgi:hypothetical protein